MELDIDAVYIRDTDINIRGNTSISLCYAAHKLYPGEIHGAQLVNGFWSIYTRSNKTRTALITSGVIIDGATIKVYDDNRGGLDLPPHRPYGGGPLTQPCIFFMNLYVVKHI